MTAFCQWVARRPYTAAYIPLVGVLAAVVAIVQALAR